MENWEEDEEEGVSGVVAEATKLSIKTPWEEIMELFQRASAAREKSRQEREEEAESYESCIRINGRPILPPLMTPEKREECRRWRERAVSLEKRRRSAERETEGGSGDREQPDNSFRISDSDDDDDEPVVFSRASSAAPAVVDVHPAAVTVGGTAFKSLIHKLRKEVPGPVVSPDAAPPVATPSARPSHYDSNMSVNTVIENPQFVCGPQQSKEVSPRSPPPPFRARSGSYTLDEPSPLLKAYMERYGGEAGEMIPSSRSASALSALAPLSAKNEDSRTVSALSSVSATTKVRSFVDGLPLRSDFKSKEESESHLDQYLVNLAQMPLNLTEETSSNPSKAEVEAKPASQVTTYEIVSTEREAPFKDPDDEFSTASSLLKSVSIRIDAARNVELVPEAKLIEQSQMKSPSEEIAKNVQTNDEEETNPAKSENAAQEQDANDREKATSEGITHEEAPTTARSRQIEVAVSTLAKNQQSQIQRLLEEQARQREEMKRIFEEQQKALISQIMVLSGGPPPSADPCDSPAPAAADARPQNSNIGASEISTTADATSTALQPPPQSAPRAPSPVIPTVAAHLRPVSTLPTDYALPPEAQTAEMHPKFCRLSALAKGYLTRRLLATQKVEGVIASIRDTMNTAFQLHKDAATSKEDVELHRRLLQQLNRDYQTLNDIFVESSPAERMALIALDSEMRQRQEAEKENDAPAPRRVSAATRARQEQRQRMAQLAVDENAAPPRQRRMRTKSLGRGEYHPAVVMRQKSEIASGVYLKHIQVLQFLLFLFSPAFGFSSE